MSEPAAKRARGLSGSGDELVVLTGGFAYPEACIERWRRCDHCDVTLLDKAATANPAHRLVLASGSAFMDGMFRSGMRESHQTSIQLDVSNSSLKAALEWLYCGTVNVEEQDLLDLMQSAAFLQIDSLQKAATQAISGRVSLANCLEVFQLADALGAAALPLEEAARCTTLRHFDTIAAGKQHLKLSAAQFRALLVDPRLSGNEEKIFTAVITWLQDRHPSQEDQLSILRLVRYPLLSNRFIRERVWTEAIMETPAILKVVTESYMAAYHGQPWPDIGALGGITMEKDIGPLLHGCAVLVSNAATGRWTLPSFDVARGRERFPLTINPSFEHNGGHYYGRLPPQLTGSHSDESGVRSGFTYDAGPIPAPVKLQIFRGGRPSGLGYGLRILQDALKGSLVVVYWGVYYYGKMDDLFDRGILRHKLRELVQTYCVHCPGDPGTCPQYSIDASRSANAARWINHSDRPNLELRPLATTTALLESPDDETASAPLMGLFATRDLKCGDELLWNYNGYTTEVRGRAARKSAPAMGGVKLPPPGMDDLEHEGYELLRHLPDGKLRAALWRSDKSVSPSGKRVQFGMEAVWLQGETRPSFFTREETGDSDDSEDDESYYAERGLNFPERLLPADNAPWTAEEEDWRDYDELNEPSCDWWKDLLPFWKDYAVYRPGSAASH